MLRGTSFWVGGLLLATLCACEGQIGLLPGEEGAAPGGVEGPGEPPSALPSTELTGSLLLELRATPARLAEGETFVLEAAVTNTGEAPLLEVTVDAIRPSGVGAMRLLEPMAPTSVELAPGASQIFQVIYEAMEAGPLVLETRAWGRDPAGVQVDSPSVQLSLQVDGPPILTVEEIGVPALVAVGADIPVRMVVTNGGQSPARAVVPTELELEGTGAVTRVSGPTPAAVDIAAGASAEFQWRYRASGPGRVLFRGGAGTSDGIRVEAPGASSAAMDIETPAELELSLSVPTQLTTGQNFTATLVVRNKGTSAARGVLPSPLLPTVTATSGDAGAALLGNPPLAADIPGGGMALFEWRFAATGTGSFTLGTGVSGTDAVTGGALTTAQVTSLPSRVLAPTALVVTSLTVPSRIQRGQTFEVVMTVRNAGEVAANGVVPAPVSPALTVTGAAGATTTSTPAAVTLEAGASTTFTWSFRENGTGPGELRFSGGARGTDSVTQTQVTANSTESGVLLVVSPPALVVDSITVPTRLSRGQPFRAEVVVRNSGGATAENVRPTIGFTSAGGPAVTTATAPTPVSLAGGARSTFSLDLVESGTAAGTFRLEATASGTNADTAAPVTSPRVQSNVVTVESPASLSITSVSLPTSLKTGETFTLSLTVTNSGQAAALSVLPVPSPPAATATGGVRVNTTSTVSAVTVPGGGRQTFSWSYVESGNGAGNVTFTAGARGVDANSGNTVTALNRSSNPAQVLSPCDPSQFMGVQLETLANEFANDVYPLMARAMSGCASCHAGSSGRPFVVTASGTETFHLARAAGFLKDGPGSILDRLTATDPLLVMPKGQPAWSATEIQAQANIVCKLKAYEASAPPADEQFPVNLLQPYSGPASTYYDNTFLKYLQLRGKVRTVFNDTWTRDGVDQFQANLGLFGGVDFQTRFVEAREATAEFLTGLDKLAPDICAPAATNRTGPFAGVDTTSALSDTTSGAGIDTVYRRMLFRPALSTERTEALTMMRDIVGLGLPASSAWAGLCEALVRHPDFLFTLPPSRSQFSGADKLGLLLVKVAQDLLARPPTSAELSAVTGGSRTLDAQIDLYLASTEFRDNYFHRMRVRTESNGTPTGDEPARLWTYLMMNEAPMAELLTGEYGVDASFAKVSRPVQHGKTGILTMKGFIQGKPGLPHYNYAARVFSDYLGTLFEVPPEVLDMRATSTAASTVDPTSICFNCHQNLTPLAHQRLRWDDEGNYRTTDSSGAPIDDSDRGLVSTYAYKGQGLQAFSTTAVRKEAFIRRGINAHFEMVMGRPLRHAEDERTLYKQLWDVHAASNGNMKAMLRTILRSPNYQKP